MICKQCEHDKLPGHFYWKQNARVAYGQRCKDCCGENREKPEYKLKQRENNIKRLYGISPEEYQVLFEKQDGKCALCKEESKAKGKNATLHVDHDHINNKVRGLLCYGCNIAIGFLNEDLERIYQVIDYLNLHQTIGEK